MGAGIQAPGPLNKVAAGISNPSPISALSFAKAVQQTHSQDLSGSAGIVRLAITGRHPILTVLNSRPDSRTSDFLCHTVLPNLVDVSHEYDLNGQSRVWLLAAGTNLNAIAL